MRAQSFASLVALVLTTTAAGCGIPRSLLFAARAPAPVDPGSATLVRFPVEPGVEGAALHVPAPVDRPTIVHFHGNSQQLADLGPLIGLLRDQRLGVYAVEYPGYGVSSAYSANEASFYALADAALVYLHERLGVAARDVVLMGQSLGTGVAAEMALRGHGARLILISPYTSIDALGAHWFPLVPPRWIVDDHFDTASKAGRITMPVLIVDGLHDGIIPPRMSEELASAFPQATTLWVRSGHHNDLFAPTRREELVACLAAFATLDSK